ncbi:VPLPA-CTERM sorting domain-containing protein [Pararhodobacter sp. SW119]|uniref:VPLPA-CTERM sorting domain-containing protein n=1 Tax=Pararhodobacter sp. SW119 TaxID=2780075 RepID=UPI001AE035E0|nr:VPLPA-CTERM sorting domain-containing protein [Pararhodobacter sp. SW119]
MKPPLIHTAAAAALLAFMPLTALSSTLDGQTVRIDHLWQPSSDLIVVDTSGNVIVGSGVEYTYTDVFSRDTYTVDIDDTLVTVAFLPDSTGLSEADFNGFRITDVLGVIPDFTSFDILSAGPSFTNALATFDADNLYLNFAGAMFVAGQEIQLRVGFDTPFAPIPLPAGLPFLLTGLFGLGAVAMRRRRVAS